MKILPYILLLILAAGLLYMWLDKDSGRVQERQKLETVYKDSIQLIRDSFNTIITKKDYEFYLTFKRTQEAANRMEGEANHWKEKYNNEKKRKTGIVTDRAYDSLLTVLYPR